MRRLLGTLRHRARDERGFTLVELMMAIAIMAIILGPLTAGLVVGLRTTDETYTRLANSNAAQLLSVWLPPDVQSAGNQTGDVVGSPTANTDCSGITNLLRLQWRETQGSTTNTYVAAYAVTQNTLDGTYRLVRYFCVNGGAATIHVVSRDLVNASVGTVLISGTKVAVTLTGAPTPTNPASYTYTVSASRRTPDTATTTTTTSGTIPNLAGVIFTNVNDGKGKLTCTYSFPNVTCTDSGLGATGSFSAIVTLVDASKNPLANTTSAAITVSATVSTVNSPGASLTPTSSTIATGTSTSTSAFTMTGNGKGWKATMTCSITVNGSTYTVAVTGN